MVNTEVPKFSSLYLAEDKDTALQEHLGQEPLNSSSVLTPQQIALTNPSSETIVSVSGKLDKVFDLTNDGNLSDFVKLMSEFTLSRKLTEQGKKLQMPLPKIVKQTKELVASILCDNWRYLPSAYDVPANSQIFGHLIYSSGIEGILYPSKFNKKLCLAIFPPNFRETDSYLMLDDEPPHQLVPTKLDGKNWRVSELSPNEIFE